MRSYPNPSMDTLKIFVVHTNLLERLPMNLKIVEKTMKEGKEHGDPLAAGQFSAINQVLAVAKKEDLIPSPSLLKTEVESSEHLQWIRDLHSSVFTPIVTSAEKKLDPNCIPRHAIGRYRTSRRVIGPRTMPSPFAINRLLHHLLKDLATFHQSMASKIQNPFSLSKDDIHQLAQRAHDVNLRLCCIKPFEDGSNRIARLVENALRLNWGLPWKTILIDEKDDYLARIFEMQKNYPENS